MNIIRSNRDETERSIDNSDFALKFKFQYSIHNANERES